jgi:RimJ/RimL family protein N-acetyltransferase
MRIVDAKIVIPGDVEWLRTHYRAESDSQIVHDSLHARSGWTVCYQLSADRQVAGFASIAINGPWKDRPTIYEFFLLNEFRHLAFELFEVFLRESKAKFFEVQSNHSLLTAMLFRYAENVRSESIVFQDHCATQLMVDDAKVASQTTDQDIRSALDRRSGGGEWTISTGDVAIGSGGILFHYNRPYGDIYMEIKEAYRRRGFGAYFVQELKRVCYQLGAVPCARCNPANVASQRTLQKAGFVPYAHILDGDLMKDW